MGDMDESRLERPQFAEPACGGDSKEVTSASAAVDCVFSPSIEATAASCDDAGAADRAAAEEAGGRSSNNSDSSCGDAPGCSQLVAHVAAEEAPRCDKLVHKPDARSDAGPEPGNDHGRHQEGDRLAFVNFRIHNRTVTQEMWRDEIETKGREIWTMARVREEFKKRALPQVQTADHVFVGVLYERSLQAQFGNGERYAYWGLTDMAGECPGRINLHLRWEAYRHWSTSRAAAIATRGSIFALMNPSLVRDGDGVQFHVKKPHQLFKLGDCPDLGKCQTKSCTQPCGPKDRLCFWCLNKEFFKKSGRIAAGGGHRNTEHFKEAAKAALQGQSMAGRDALRMQKQLRQQQLLEQEAWDKLEADPKELEKQADRKRKAELALSLDDRRFFTSAVRLAYGKAAQAGTRTDTLATSLVPKLARGMQESDEIEVDIACIDTVSRRKAERMVAKHQHLAAERRSEQQGKRQDSNSLQLVLEPQAKKPKLVDGDDSGLPCRPVAPKSLKELAKIAKLR